MTEKDELLIPNWQINNNTSSNRLIAGFTTASLGNQSLFRKSISLKTNTIDNRKNLAKILGISVEYIFSSHQIHSDKVLEVIKQDQGRGSIDISTAFDGDASITQENNILLFTTYADCVPILLYDPNTKWIATIHSGWKGTRLNIVKKTISLLKSKLVNNKNLLAAIGPAIRSCCYEVNKEFKSFFNGPIKNKFFYQKNNKSFFDLSAAVHWQLLNEGIKQSNIDFYGQCTCCNKKPSFFSYRRDKEIYETQGAFIGIFTR